MEPEILSETPPPTLVEDKKLAHTSLLLLFWISLLHALWLIFRNLNHIGDVFNHTEYENIIFIFGFALIIVLNFIPPIWANRLNKKGLYRRQIKISIISFIIFQIILHFILFALARLFGSTLC